MTYNIKVAVLHDKIFFTFVDNISGGLFEETKSGITIARSFDATAKHPRWGLVHGVGPKVRDINVGDYILVENLRWTEGFPCETDGEPVKMWMTKESEVLLVSTDRPSN